MLRDSFGSVHEGLVHPRRDAHPWRRGLARLRDGSTRLEVILHLHVLDFELIILELALVLYLC